MITVDLGWLNVTGLLLGLLAWALPIISVLLHKIGIFPLVISGWACILSLYAQLARAFHLVRIGDWAALIGTGGAVLAVAGLLVAVTLALNAVALLARRRNGGK